MYCLWFWITCWNRPCEAVPKGPRLSACVELQGLQGDTAYRFRVWPEILGPRMGSTEDWYHWSRLFEISSYSWIVRNSDIYAYRRYLIDFTFGYGYLWFCFSRSAGQKVWPCASISITVPFFWVLAWLVALLLCSGIQLVGASAPLRRS